jgi:hypothetical protein
MANIIDLRGNNVNVMLGGLERDEATMRDLA